jgi:hypothetical protein
MNHAILSTASDLGNVYKALYKYSIRIIYPYFLPLNLELRALYDNKRT